MAIDNHVKEKLVFKSDTVVGALAIGGAANLKPEHTLQRYGNLELRYSATVDPQAVPQLPAMGNRRLSTTERLAIDAFKLRASDVYKAAKLARPRDKEPWNMKGCITTPPSTSASAEAGAPALEASATIPTSGWLEGSVAVGTVIVNGPTEDLHFTDAEQTKVIAEVQAGLGWLASQALSAKVTFVHDIHLVQITVPANKNITNFDNLETLWRNPVMTSLGYAASWQGVVDYVNALREKMQTKWAYVAFFVKYPLGHFAYASIGGPRLVMQYANDGWGPDNIDRVFAHETGHIFGCADEYAASNCNCEGEWGRFLEPNRNCQNCAGTAGVSCIMRSNEWATCQSARMQFGWTGWPAPIVAVHSNLVLDVAGVSLNQGVAINQWPWNGGKNQRFLADALDDGTFRLVAEHSGMALTVENASTSAGAKLIQAPWNAAQNQRFWLEQQTDNTYRIVAKHSGLVLDISGNSLGNGVPLVQWNWHGGNNQRFRILSRGITIQAVHSNLVLDVSGAAMNDGAKVIQWPRHNGANQRFHLDPLDNGTWRILVAHSGLVLDVAGASTAKGANVIQSKWHGGKNQCFLVETLGNGQFRLIAAHSGLALDISGSSVNNGTQLIQWTWHGGNNQRFKLV